MVDDVNERVEHIVWVARRCADIAKERGYNEEIQKQAFLIGWNIHLIYQKEVVSN